MPTFKLQETLPQSFSPDSVESENGNFILSRFNVSNYGNYLLVTSGCIIYVYRLLTRKAGHSMLVSLVDTSDLDLVPVFNIVCRVEVLSATIDTSTLKFIVAALFCGCIGIICDLEMEPVSLHSQIKRKAYAVDCTVMPTYSA